MAVQCWTSEIEGGVEDGEALIRRCFAHLDLAIDEEISNSHQLFARDQGPGKMVRGEYVSVLASRSSGGGNLVRFEVRSGESSLLRNSHCQQLADALKDVLQKLLSRAS